MEPTIVQIKHPTEDRNMRPRELGRLKREFYYFLPNVITDLRDEVRRFWRYKFDRNDPLREKLFFEFVMQTRKFF